MDFFKKHQYNIALLIPFIIDSQIFWGIDFGNWRNEVSYEIAKRMTYMTLFIGLVFLAYYVCFIYLLIKSKYTRKQILLPIPFMILGFLNCIAAL